MGQNPTGLRASQTQERKPVSEYKAGEKKCLGEHKETMR